MTTIGVPRNFIDRIRFHCERLGIKRAQLMSLLLDLLDDPHNKAIIERFVAEQKQYEDKK
jgi:hypothetical protein